MAQIQINNITLGMTETSSMPDAAAAAPVAVSGPAVPGGAGLLDQEVAVRLPEDGVHPSSLRHLDTRFSSNSNQF